MALRVTARPTTDTRTIRQQVGTIAAGIIMEAALTIERALVICILVILTVYLATRLL